MTSPASETAGNSPVGERTVRRVAWLIPAFGFVATFLALFFQRWDWAQGLAAGAALAWFNFHWLKRGVEAFTGRSAGQAGALKRRSHAAAFVAALFRYVLIGAAVYVIFKYLHVPLVSIAVGLCAFVAATITASVWEILQSVKMRS